MLQAEVKQSSHYDKLVVSLTTTPGRIAYLERTIQSIKMQSLIPDSIEINIPFEYRKRNLGTVDISSLPDGIEVYRCDDSGPATKILPTLARYAGQRVCIIYCDDDRLYDSGWIERLVSLSFTFPTACIADEAIQIRNRVYSKAYPKDFSYRLRRFISFGFWKPRKNDATRGEIAEGYGGVLVRPEFFDEEVHRVPEEFVMVDDVWISAMLAKREVPIIFSGRQRTERSKEVVVDGKDLGRTEGSLVTTIHQGKGRVDLDYDAIMLASKRFNIWIESLAELKKT